MIRLVVCDLETTIMSDDYVVSDEIITLIPELKKQNILFAVVTGFNYDAVHPLFGNLKNDIVFICNDGGTIIFQENVISKTPIDRLICLDIEREITEKKDFYISYATERSLCVTTHKYDFLKSFGTNSAFFSGKNKTSSS